MGNQHAMDLFEEEKKFIKAQVLHTIFHNEEKPLFRCQYESH